MFERWTIDSLAGAVHDQVLEADPTPKLVRRFYRQGWRHGRRRVDGNPVRDYIVQGVEIAVSEINESYRQEVTNLQVQIAAAELNAHHAGEAAEAVTIPSGDLVVPDTAGAAVPGAPEAPQVDQLDDSLRGLRQKRADAMKEKAEQARLAKTQEAEAARLQAAQLQSQLANLDANYEQRIESCKEYGEFLWARYRGGYTDGRSRTRRRYRAIEQAPPEQDISFDGLAVVHRADEPSGPAVEANPVVPVPAS